mmetsp:Transcript_50487/g.117866  ORF Transcript_50487/g.117866 Transcript_50487/m.117866 type:complete len:317 (+) Transcript_50487:99-1049(+)
MDLRPSSSASVGTGSQRLRVQVSAPATGSSPKAQSRPTVSPLGRAGAAMLSGSGVASPATPAIVVAPARERLSGETALAHPAPESSLSAGGPADQLEQLADRLATSSVSSVQSKASKEVVDGQGGLTDKEVVKFHSALRWDKPWNEVVDAAGSCDLKAACTTRDPKTGNVALHIACQNGHLSTVERLLSMGVSVNVQNEKGQTPLHMSAEYDFYFVCKALLGANADVSIENKDGKKAIAGIEGTKVGSKAYDNPVNILKSASTSEQLEEAFLKLEDAAAKGGEVDKAELIQTGMQKKKAGKDNWDHKRFMQLAARF